MEQNPELTREEISVSDLDRVLYGTSISPSSLEKVKTGDVYEAEISMNGNKLPDCGVVFTSGPIKEEITALPLETIDLKKYFLISFSGYDGVGTASYIFAQTALQRDLQKLFEEHGRAAYGPITEETNLAAEAKDAAQVIADRIRWDYATSIDRTELLSKGETIHFSSIANQHTEGFGEDEKLYTDMGIVLKDSDGEIPVIGLKDPKEVDLTDALTVTFEGILPNITVTRTIDESLPFAAGSNIRNAAGTERILGKNGDTYSGSIEYDPVDYLKRGYKVTNAYYRYEIQGIPFYQLTLEDAGDERIATLSGENLALLEERRNAYTLEGLALAEGGKKVIWSDTRTALEDVTEALYETEDSAGNTLYLTWHTVLPVRMSDMSVQKKDVYEVMSTRNILENTDGTFTPQNDWSYKVYGSLEEAQEAIRSDCESNYGGAAELKTITLDTAEALTISAQSLNELSGETYVDELNTKAAPDDALAGQAVRTAVVDGHVYYRFDTLLSFEDAQKFCEENGGHLLTLQTGKEELAVRYLLQEQNSDYYWIGGKETGIEGVYAWTTGEPFTGENWEDGQPDNNTSYSEEGESLLGVTFNWDRCVIHDLSDAEYGFILETEPAEEAIGWSELADAARIRSYGTSLYGEVNDPYGNRYFRSVALNTWENAVTDYRLDGRYSLLCATLSTEADTDSEALMSICIWGDGELLFSRYDYAKTDAPVSFTVNVEGVKRLSVQAGSTQAGGRLFLNNAALKDAAAADEAAEEAAEAAEETAEEGTETAEETAEEAAQTAGEAAEEAAQTADGAEGAGTGYSRLFFELPVISSSDCSVYENSGMNQNAEGIYIPDAVDFNTGYSARYVLNLDGEYTRFTAELASLSVPERGAEANVYFYGDGNLLYSAEGLRAESPAEAIDLDVTGVKVLDIRTDAGENGIGQVVRLGRTAFVPAAKEEEQAILPVPEFPELPQEYAGLLANGLVFGNHMYLRADEALSFDDAESLLAEKAGGHLAMPASEQENELIRELIYYGPQETYWLGGKASGRNHATWTWLDGRPFDGGYTNWDYDQPDNYDGVENLLEMGKDGLWNDISPDSLAGSVIQVDALSEAEESGASFGDLEQLYAEYAEQKSLRLADRKPEVYFPDALFLGAGNNGFAGYLLNGEYSRFHAYLTRTNMSENTAARIAVFGDGHLLFAEDDIRADSGIKELSIDVSGVKELVIRTGLTKNGGSAELVLFGADFTGTGSHTGAEAARLNAQTVVDSRSTQTDPDLFVDALSVPHDGYLALRADDQAYILYNIAGGFETFSGAISAGWDTPLDETVTIRILLDDEEAFVLENYNRLSGSIPFSLDVAGAQTLRIEAQGEAGNSWVYITDDSLAKNSGRRRSGSSFE